MRNSWNGWKREKSSSAPREFCSAICSMSEEDAYLTLQRESRQRRKSMKEVAEAIILSEDLKKKK